MPLFEFVGVVDPSIDASVVSTLMFQDISDDMKYFLCTLVARTNVMDTYNKNQ